jgi:DNA-binding protein YbaB
MFDKFKQLKQLKEMQEAIKKEVVSVEKEGITVVLNGNFEVVELNLNPNLSIENQANFLKQCLNEAVKKVQSNLAQKFSGMI